MLDIIQGDSCSLLKCGKRFAFVFWKITKVMKFLVNYRGTVLFFHQFCVHVYDIFVFSECDFSICTFNIL